MRSAHILVVILVVGLGTAATPAGAQQARAQVRQEIERTDRSIERARTTVGGSGIAAALFELNEAARVQENARGALKAGRPRVALTLTLRARGRADRALAMVEDLPDPRRVSTQLERTRELLERAWDLLKGCPDDGARRLLRTGFELQGQAEQASQAGRQLAALQLTTMARDRASRALRRCHLGEDVRDAAGRALQRTDEVIQLAQGSSSRANRRPAWGLVARAIDAQDRAKRAYAEQQYAACLRLTLTARALAHRALRSARG